MFGSTEFLYDKFEKTKSAVKRDPYIAGVIIILLLICLLVFFRDSGIKNEPSDVKIVSSKSSHFDALQNTKVPAIEKPKIRKPKAQEPTTAKSTTTTTWISTTTLKYFTIFDAVSEGEPKDVEALIEKGVNLNRQNELGQTALHLAIERGTESIAKILIENGANGNIQDNNGYSSLALALKTDQQSIAHLILDDVNFGIASWNKDILGHKACNVSGKLVDAFKKKGVDISIDAENELRKAINNDDVNKTQLILDNCIDDINEHKSIRPLALTAEGCTVNVATMLIQKGANVDYPDPNHWRPIHVASYNGCKPVVKMLIDHHANINATIHVGLSALCIANRQNQHEIAEMLKKANAVAICG